MVKLTSTVEYLRRMERLADTMLERIDILLRLQQQQQQHESGGEGRGERPSSLKLRLHRVIREIARARIKILRRICHLVLGAVTTLGPELQTLIMFAIDYNCMHYLAESTACEMVYGLKRSKVVRADVRHQRLLKDARNNRNIITPTLDTVVDLTKFDKTLSAILAALLPYCKERCDKLYSHWKEEETVEETEPSHTGVRSMRNYHQPPNNHIQTNRPHLVDTNSIAYTKEKFVKLYPYLHMVHDGSIFLYQFAYLLGYTHYWSFSLHAMRVILRRMTVADVQQQQQQQLQQQQEQHRNDEAQPRRSFPNTQHEQAANNSSGQTSILPRQLTLPRLLQGAILFSISYTLLSGWGSYFRYQLRLRRRRWIAGHEDDTITTRQVSGTTNIDDETHRQRSSIATKLPIPPPPLPPNLIGDIDPSVDKWSCPICKETRINPTAATSGYVYCYKCIVSHIRNVGEYCPLTGMPCPERRVVRLFEPTAPTARRGAVSS